MMDIGGYRSKNDGGNFKENRIGSMLFEHQLNLYYACPCAWPPPASLPGTEVKILHVILGDSPLHSNLMAQ